MSRWRHSICHASRKSCPYLERLHDELEIPILYVSHSPDEVARLADHLVVLDAGRAVASGPLAETLARLDLPIRLGEDVGVVLTGRLPNGMRVASGASECEGADFWVRDGGHSWSSGADSYPRPGCQHRPEPDNRFQHPQYHARRGDRDR